MSTLEEKLAEQEKTAATSAAESRETHLAADQAKLDAGSAARDAQAADAVADGSEGVAGSMEKVAANSDGTAKAAEGACGSATENQSKAESELAQKQKEAAQVRALNPGECNAETAAADNAVMAAETRLTTAKEQRESACERAAKARKQATADAERAGTARAAATSDRTRSDELEKAAKAAETKAEGLRTLAVMKAALADVAQKQVESIKNEIAEAAAAAKAADAPKHPSTTGEAALCGCPAQPENGPGIHSWTEGNFTTAFKEFNKFLIGGDDYQKIEGKLVELTEGNTITHTVSAEVSVVLGGKLDETFGIELKCDFMDDTRYVKGYRWERNVGIKVEHVLGDVTETIMGSRVELDPTFYHGKNPKKRAECEKELNHKATDIVEKYKDKLEEFRKTLKVDYEEQKRAMDSIASRAKHYQANLKKSTEEVDVLEAKLDDLKVQAKNYAMNSESFIKFLVDGAVDISADRFFGNAGNRYNIVCDMVAEMQGSEIKWA
ncbi:MAG: hypothetical protein SGI90_01815 [Candidatus Eisenbacteria bacterium]|nr:hypothetical protein [Candidatus Eisenbacteria bacterium]